MARISLFQMLKFVSERIQGHRQGSRAIKPQRRFSPTVEALEDRALPSASSILSNVLSEVRFHAETARPPQAEVVIVTPTGGSQLGRYVTVTGKLEAKVKGWPVVLVQPILSGEPWYVQPAVVTVNPDGTFSDSIYIGNGSTPPHTQFRIEVILAKNQAQAQKLYPEGITLKTLPKGLPHSAVDVVSRAGLIIG